MSSWLFWTRVALAAADIQSSASDVTREGCNWQCPAEDAHIWTAVQGLDFGRGDVFSIWQLLNAQVGSLKNAEACEPGLFLIKLWTFLTEQTTGNGHRALRLHVLEALQTQLRAHCGLAAAALDGCEFARPWALATLGALRRLSELFSGSESDAEEDAPLTPCLGRLRYHEKGFEDLFPLSVFNEQDTIFPLHRPVAFLQLGHNRCNPGMAAAVALVARTLLQLVQRKCILKEAASIVDTVWTEWAFSEVENIVSLAVAYIGDEADKLWEVVVSDWSPVLTILHEIIEAGVCFSSSPVRGCSGRILVGRGPLRYLLATSSEDDTVDSGVWSEGVACAFVWRGVPGLAEVVEALAADPQSLRFDESFLRTVAGISDSAAQSCEIAAVARLFATTAISNGSRSVAEIVCSDALEQTFDFVRGISAEVLVDPHFVHWAVLLFGLLDHLRGRSHGEAACAAASADRNLCDPAPLSSRFLDLIRVSLHREEIVSPSAAVAFLARSNSMCSSGIVMGHLALAEALLILTDMPGTGDWEKSHPIVASSPTDKCVYASGLEARLLERTALQEVSLSARPVVGGNRWSQHRYQQLHRNSSWASCHPLRQDLYRLLDGAWVVAVGERPHIFVAGEWPITSFFLRVVARLARGSLWRPPRFRPEINDYTQSRRDETRGQPMFDESSGLESSPSTLGNVIAASSPSFTTSDSYVVGSRMRRTLDLVEAILETAGEQLLCDQLFAAAAQVPDAKPGSVLAAVHWLYEQHFDASGMPRPGKGLNKFVRRLRLLLRSPTTHP